MRETVTRIEFNKAFFLGERRVRKISALSFFRGLKKLKGWRKLSGFRKKPDNFTIRMGFENLNLYQFSALLGQLNPAPKENADCRWLIDALNYEYFGIDLPKYYARFPVLNDYAARGLINPFLGQIAKNIEKIKDLTGANDTQLEICLKSQLPTIETLARKAVVLELNICAIKGELQGKEASEQFQYFAERFESHERRLDFFKKYPVLFRMIVTRLDLWSQFASEFLERLELDRQAIKECFNIPDSANLNSIMPSGDTHNNGRSVIVVEFSDESKIVYKPRDTSLEFCFQKYLEFFNLANPGLCLRCMNVLDRKSYGWVEYVPFLDQTTQTESDTYHYKLGFLTAIVYSINGVDVFFENLISAGSDPVIIDLETMFHTPIDKIRGKGPQATLQLLLHDSVSGIGILPQPNPGASESEIFDVSVMGAKKNAQAPYKVNGIENFGRSDMKITEINGWIQENKASGDDAFQYKRKAQFLFNGLKDGLQSVLNHQEHLGRPGGLIDKYFADAKRRLIVRDTKVYGALQQDETHPDLLKDQLDRQWHLDNLWFDVLDRPQLLAFVESELNQLKQGDIPYFAGATASTIVTGGDGAHIDLSKILDETPIDSARIKILNLNKEIIEDQARIAATTLGLDRIPGLTQPEFDPNASATANALNIGDYLISRIKRLDGLSWSDTSINPTPAVKTLDSVRVVPADPFLYDGTLGVAMFLHDLWSCTGETRFLQNALSLTHSVLQELEVNSDFIPSGFAGLSSVVYALNRNIEKASPQFLQFDAKLPKIVDSIIEKSRVEERLDFLLGLAGIACALLPYTKRTGSSKAQNLLHYLTSRLFDSGNEILKSNEAISGMDYIRGFSHGISGVALALYRLGEYFDRDALVDLATTLIVHEYNLVKEGQWTDSHVFNGEPLVGWCHGSAGIALALSAMPEVFQRHQAIEEYYNLAVANTLTKGAYSSMCLCHGTAGNLICLAKFKLGNLLANAMSEQLKSDLLHSGFSSMGAAQTMGIGLMTGLTGAGYYLISKDRPQVDFGFLSLS